METHFEELEKLAGLPRSLREDEKRKFRDLWKGLSTPAKQLLISGSHGNVTGLSREALMYSSELQEAEFKQAEQELLNKGLIGIGPAPDFDQSRFSREMKDRGHTFQNPENRRHLTAEVQAFVIREILEVEK